MEKIVVQYKYVDASSEASSYIWIIVIVAVLALFMPSLWIFVAVAALCVLPIQYFEDKKRQKRCKENIPALVIDGYILYYDGKTIDLSQMHTAFFHQDMDYDGNILICRKGRIWPVIEIYTDNMLIDRDELLKLINDRIDRAKGLQ